MALALEKQGRIPEAIASLKSAVKKSKAPLFKALLGHAYGLAGEQAKALSILDELEAHVKAAICLADGLRDGLYGTR